MKKTFKVKTLWSRIVPSLAVGLVAFSAVRANAAHELCYALDFLSGDVISFFSDAPSTILSDHPVSGLQANEDIRGMDVGPGNVLYALGSFSHLYTIDPNTGNATAVGGQFSTLISGSTFGMDIGPTGVRIVSDLGQQLLINTTTGVATGQPGPAYAAGDPHFGATPRIDALAFNPTTGQWVAGDSLLNLFATFTPGTGALNTIGNAGIDFARGNGLDFSQTTGILYLASPAASSDPQANLYTVNPLTGAVTLVGQIGAPGDNVLIRGFTVASVPEPSSLALLAIGGLVMALRRRK